MAQEQPAGTTDRKANAMAFLSFAESAVALQKEMLETYERLGRAWLDRIQAEVELWNGLSQTLATSKSAAQAMKAYTECVSRQMQMNADDGRRLFADYQEITQKIAKVVAEDTRIAPAAAAATAEAVKSAVADAHITH